MDSNSVTMDYESIKKKFFELEQNLDLFSKRIHGVCFWKLVRIYTYLKIVNSVTKSDPGHPNNAKSSTLDLLRSKLNIVVLRNKRSVFKNKERCTNIVFRHRRRVLVDGEFVEVNTAYMDQWLGLDSSKTEYVETGIAHNNRNVGDNSRFLLCSPFQLLAKRFFTKLLLKKNENKLIISEIEDKILDSFGVRINLGKLIENEIPSFLCLYKLSKRYLRYKAPSIVYLVCSYGKEGIIQAARDLGIKTVELQHGVITQFHMGYSFPKRFIPYFPDELYVYGEYWRHSASFPILENCIIDKGSPYFELQFRKYSGTEKDDKSVLFISSGGTGKELSKLALEFAKDNPSYTVYYKLHPSEFNVWHNLYQGLNDSGFRNLRVVEDAINIYELFAKCSFLVGVNSTAIFESFAFNIMVILFNLPGVSYMNDIIERYNLPLVNNSAQLNELVHSYPSCVRVKSDSFYSRIEC